MAMRGVHRSSRWLEGSGHVCSCGGRCALTLGRYVIPMEAIIGRARAQARDFRAVCWWISPHVGVSMPVLVTLVWAMRAWTQLSCHLFAVACGPVHCACAVCSSLTSVT